MTDQQPPTGPTEGATTDSSIGDESADRQEQDHDCQQHLEFVNYEWVESTYDDCYECGVCGAEYRIVYLKAFLLDGEDFSLVEEYTDEIERQLEQHRNHDTSEKTEGEDPTAE